MCVDATMSRHQPTLKSPKDVETYHSNEKNGFPKSESFTLKSNTNHVTFQRTYRVVYMGYAVLDRRYTLPMLPWVIAEIKRHGSENEEEIDIEVTEQSLKAVSCVTKMLVFEHKLQTISKFAQSSQDSSCFTYMTREVVTGPCAYHVFQAIDENIVVELFTAMREMSKEMFNQHPQATVIGKTASGVALDSVINSCQQYEVLYVGRIKVSGKRAPPAFIDDAVEKFRIFGIEKTRSHHGFSKRRRHGSGASVSSLPHNLDILEKPSENGLQKQIKLSSKDDLSTSSGISSCESISQRSLDTINQIYCDTDPALHSSQSSLHNSDQVSTFPTHSQSLVSHSQSMDIASAAKMLLDLKQTDCQCSLMPPSSLITHTQSLDAPACADIVRDLRDSDPGVVLRDRVRSCSGDIPRAKQTSLPTFQCKVDIGGIYDMRRPRAYTSPCPSDNRQCNRTMLFLIGRMEICLIGTDKKQMLMSKTFNDIAHCSQGVKHLDHFGFICRETTLSGADCYSGYIFRCQTEKVVDEMMQTLKLAFSKAHQNYQHSEKSYQVPKVFICETCPMHWFHKLCSDIEGLSPEEAHLIILRRLGSLPDADKEYVMVKFQDTFSNDEQGQNEILMMLLRELCEQNQLKHSHITNSYTNGKNSLHAKEKSSKLDSFRQKAKKSLSSSFETFLKLTNRDDLKDSTVNAVNKTTSINDSALKDLDSRSYREGSCDSSRYLSDRTSPLSSRPRSSTFSTSREMHLSKKQNLTPDPLQHKRPIMNMFMKSSTPLKTPSPLQMESKGSWRQAIFHRVQTPGPSQNNKLFVAQIDEIDLNPTSLDGEPKLHCKKTKEELRALWKKAIIEQILLIRMEKENRKLQVNQDAACSKRMKLNYEEITPCIKAATLEWEAIINDSKHGECLMERAKMIEIVKKGVPRSKRGEIWQFLAEKKRDTWLKSKKDIGSNESYEDLLKQLTSHQHSILIDIGRTFPNHPFYSQTLGSGQLSLFNLLKAYSLLDKEVGYCQGLSFVAGILLLHMPEEQAFSLMKFLMFDLGLRRQYKTDMVAFQIQMYQLSRLIHDNYKDLYDHLEKFDIAPTLYAAPWFLTLFASQFPVGFVARLFDLIFLCGMDVVFKVSLMLLGNYKDCILNCDSFESTMNFLKISLPSIDVLQMQIIFNQVFNLDISRQLHAYEVEYHVLLEEMVYSPNKDSAELENLRSANKRLKAQNMELMEQLQVAYSRIHQLEASDASLKSTNRRLEDRVAALEDEKEGLIYSMRIMKKRLEKLEVERWDKANFSEMENDGHAPPFGVVYALAGSEKEEDEQFKMFIKKYCQEKDSEKGTKEPKISDGNLKNDDIAEENTSVFYDAADFTNL